MISVLSDVQRSVVFMRMQTKVFFVLPYLVRLSFTSLCFSQEEGNICRLGSDYARESCGAKAWTKEQRPPTDNDCVQVLLGCCREGTVRVVLAVSEWRQMSLVCGLFILSFFSLITKYMSSLSSPLSYLFITSAGTVCHRDMC